jgi:hypothetical protein
VLLVVQRQQRMATAAASISGMRSQLQQGISILPIDLRGLSMNAVNATTGASQPDLVAGTDTSLDLRVTIGGGVICSIDAGRTTVVLAPNQRLASGARLTSWSAQPVAGDTILAMDEGATSATTDDRWPAYRISTIAQSQVSGAPGNACPTVQVLSGTVVTTPALVTAADASKPSWTLTLATAAGTATPLSATVGTGYPVRFVRRVKYALYPAADGKWYLGYCEGAQCAAASPYAPIAGPLRPFASAGSATNGVRFAFHDTTGATTATMANVSRIVVVLRGMSDSVSLAGTSRRRAKTDSTRISVAIRNR